MNQLRLGLYALVAVLVALLVGYLWGSSGRSAIKAQLDVEELVDDVAQARGSLLAARVDLFEVNFGQASRHLEAGRQWLQQGADRAAALRQDDTAAKVKNVAARLAQAQQQVGRLDQSANTNLAEAVRLLDQVAPAGELRAGSSK